MSIDEVLPVSKPRPFNKDEIVKKYGAQLQYMKVLALVSAALYSLNWFLGVCTLTWASTVILGGLLPQLGRHDFYCISALLLLEALRLAAATFFGNLVTRNLVNRSTDPTLIKYDDKIYRIDRHLIFATARIVDQTFQLLVLAISIFLPLKRLPSLPQAKPSQDNSSNFDGLHHSLRIFYILVLLNAAIAVVGVLHSKTLVPLFTSSFSLHRYYDHVVWRGMEKGFLYVTDFDFLAFAFKALADEYRRNQRAPVVYALYHDLIIYLYSHNRGFDAARIAMDSSDHCEQEAAANIVGLWAQIEGGAASLLLQSRLLTKLANALDHQEIGRAATCSFESMAKCKVDGLLEVENERGESLILILSKCIGKAVKARKEDKALVFIKVLILLLISEAEKQELSSEARMPEAAQIQGKLVEDLRSVFTAKPGCKKRTVGVAGKALKLMDKEPSAEEVHKFLRYPLPSDDEHILNDEEKYILELLNQTSLPSAWPKGRVRPITCPLLSPTSTNITTCVMGLLIFLLIGIAVILCLYKTKI